MQQQQQQQGGPQYGVPPEISQPFTGAGAVRVHVMGIPGTDATALAEAASPISSRPPPTARGSFDEMAPGTSGFQDDDTGEEAERGPPGNRWPRQETLALLKIRSEMDAVFRDATLKGPLWEDVSRKLADLGYTRSAKKCKEKFENVHKYYKRTKEGRAGRQDGKSYRFFSQLEALNSSSSSTNTTTAAAPAPVAVNPPYVSASSGLGASNLMAGSSGRPAPPTPPAPVSANLAAAAATAQTNVVPPIGPDLAGPGPGPSTAAAAAGISFSTSSSSESESEDEIEEGGSKDSRKRKRSGSGGGGGGSKKMMAFFEVLMKHVMEKQEAMQQRFLETLEKREHERMMREESWKRQEMARLAREQEIMAQERAMSASRDATVIAFLQKITGQTVPIPSPAIIIPTTAPPPPPQSIPQPQPQLRPSPSPSPSPSPQQQQQRHQHQPRPQPPPAPPPHQSQSTEIVSSSEVVVTQEEPLQHQEMAGSGSFESASSRWPKTEVLALINLRSGLDSRYQETGPKGPLWEEISAGMQRLGYNRSSKRCKEKWENINKYFKKVKESNKKRPEDAKTCPYFHQLDALYRKKALGGGSSSSLNTQSKQEQDTDANPNPQERTDVLAIMPPPPSQQQQQHSEIKSSNSNKNGGNPDTGGGGSLQVQTSNGGLPPSFLEGTAKKPEDIVKELMDDHHQLPRHHHQQPQSVMNGYNKLEELDSDHLDQEEEDDYDDEDDDEDEEDGKTAYKIEFQQQNAGPPKGERSVAPARPGSVLAMVQ